MGEKEYEIGWVEKGWEVLGENKNMIKIYCTKNFKQKRNEKDIL